MSGPADSSDYPDNPGPIPLAEKPRSDPDRSLERLEEKTLDKQARSASYRDAHERKQHLDSLNRRINVLQQKLDSRETELRDLTPRLAQLEQAQQISRVLIRDGTIIFGVGGALVSAASLFAEGIWRYSLAGFWLALFICGLWIAKILNSFIWPANRQ